MTTNSEEFDWRHDLRPPRRDWWSSQAHEVARIGQTRLERLITDLRWQDRPVEPSSVVTVQTIVDRLDLPLVTAAAFSNDLEPDLLVGVQVIFQGGRAHFYVLKRGDHVMLLVSDFWPYPRPLIITR
jgi:hypothetical protein